MVLCGFSHQGIVGIMFRLYFDCIYSWFNAKIGTYVKPQNHKTINS